MVDLRDCEPGDKLLSKHGMVLTYVKPLPEECYMDHEVRYPNIEPWLGSTGTRTHDGLVFKSSRSPEDHDIVRIIKMSYSDEEVDFIQRAIRLWWIQHNSDHEDNNKDAEISENILEKFKNK